MRRMRVIYKKETVAMFSFLSRALPTHSSSLEETELMVVAAIIDVSFFFFLFFYVIFIFVLAS